MPQVYNSIIRESGEEPVEDKSKYNQIRSKLSNWQFDKNYENIYNNLFYLDLLVIHVFNQPCTRVEFIGKQVELSMSGKHPLACSLREVVNFIQTQNLGNK